MLRQLFAVVAAAAVAAIAAVILGEYELVGTTALVAGALFGVGVAEVLVTVAKADDAPALVLAAAALTGAGLLWALWISTGRNLDFASEEGYGSITVGVLAGPAWVRAAARRGRRSHSEP